MACSIDTLTAAARRAKDVAAVIEAARVLTFLAQSRARASDADAAAPHTPAQVNAVYQTAARLGVYARQLIGDTEQLLAEPAPQEPAPEGEYDQLRSLLADAMADARRAVGMLEDLQERGVDVFQPLHEGGLESQACADALIQRLRHGH